MASVLAVTMAIAVLAGAPAHAWMLLGTDTAKPGQIAFPVSGSGSFSAQRYHRFWKSRPVDNDVGCGSPRPNLVEPLRKGRTVTGHRPKYRHQFGCRLDDCCFSPARSTRALP